MNSSSLNNPFQHQDIHLSILVLNFLLLLVGVLANTAVIIYNIFLNHDKTIRSWLLTNLASADLFVCVTIYSKKIARLFLHEKKYNELFCKMSRSTVYVSMFISLTMLLLVTVDRYVFIAKPLKYATIVTSRRVKAVLGFILLTAGVQLTIVYLYARQKGKRGENVPSCEYVKQLKWLNIIMLAIPVVFIAILNYKMFKIIQGQRQRMTSGAMLHCEQVQAEQEQSKQQALGLVKLKQVQPEQQHLKQEQPEQKKPKQVLPEQEQFEQEEPEQEQLEQEQPEQEQPEQEQSEQERPEQEQPEQEQPEQEQPEQEQPELEQPEQEQSEQEQPEQEQPELEQPEQEQSEQEQPEQEQPEPAQSEQEQPEQVPIKQSISRLRLLTRESKVIKTFAILYGGLICCVVPFLIIRTLNLITNFNVAGIGRPIILELIGINSVANPFVYALRHEKCRKAFRKLFHVYFMRKTN